MKQFLRGIVMVSLVVLPLGVGSAFAEPTIDITRGNVQPMPIAVPDFYGTAPADDAERPLGRLIFNSFSIT